MYALFLFLMLILNVTASLSIGHSSLHYYRLKYDIDGKEFTSYIYALTPYSWLRELLLRSPVSSKFALNISNLQRSRKQLLFFICLMFSGLVYRLIQDVVNTREIHLITIPLFIVVLGALYLSHKMWYLGQNMRRKKHDDYVSD